VPAGAGSFFTLEHSHEVLGRFTIQLLGSFVTNDNGRFAAFAADTLCSSSIYWASAPRKEPIFWAIILFR
jgi:hypothetical protein